MMKDEHFSRSIQQNNTTMDEKALLKRFGIRPDKKLGQNFLIDRESLERVVTAADLAGFEMVIEVGAGLGSLTRRLAQLSAKVFAIEVDQRLIPALRFALREITNVQIVQADVLKLDIDELVGESRFCVVANIPYYISSSLIRKFLSGSKQPDRMILTLQKEVAERVIAPVGKYGLLTLSVQIYGTAKIAGYIPAKAFYPTPKVESAILMIQVHETPTVPHELIQPIFSLARAGFGQKRKQLRNSLSAGMGRKPEWAAEILDQAGIDPRKRAQELSLDEWVSIARELIRTEGGIIS